MGIVANPRMPEILSSLDRLGSLEQRQHRIRCMVLLLMEEFMATEQDLLDQINHLRDLIQADQAGDQAIVDQLVEIRDNLTQQVADLQKALDEAGTQVPPSVDLDGVIAQLKNLETMIIPVKAKDSAQPTDPTVPPGETPVDPDAPPGTASLSGGSST